MKTISDAEFDSKIRKFAKECNVTHVDLIKVVACAYGVLLQYIADTEEITIIDKQKIFEICRGIGGEEVFPEVSTYLEISNQLLEIVSEP